MSRADSRSDLMALKPCPFCGGNDLTLTVNRHGWKIVECDNCGMRGPCIDLEGDEYLNRWNTRAQPAREAVARAIEGIILRRMHEKRIEGYTLEMSLEQADAILSLLSGAGTKSDGGCNCSWGCVEADNCRRKLGPLPDWKQDQSETSRIKPRPSDPSPDPDVKPAPIADSSEAGRGDDRNALAGLLREFICEFWIDKSTMMWKRTRCDDGLEMVHHDGDTIFFGDPNHQDPSDAARFDLIVRLANAAPALLRALSAPVGEPWKPGEILGIAQSADRDLAERQLPQTFQDELKALRTHPPAPAVGPDVREAWPEPKVTNPDIANPTGIPYIDGLIHQLLDAQQDINFAANTHMSQSLCDASALIDEVETAIRKLSALTRPLGGFVQGSIARKQSTDTEGSSRTETAGANVRLFVECARCGGAGFSSPGTGYDNVCSECGGLRFIPFEAAGKRPVPSVSGNTDREQQRDTMGVTAGETAPNSSAVAETDADAQREDGLLSGGEA